MSYSPVCLGIACVVFGVWAWLIYRTVWGSSFKSGELSKLRRIRFFWKWRFRKVEEEGFDISRISQIHKGKIRGLKVLVYLSEDDYEQKTFEIIFLFPKDIDIDILDVAFPSCIPSRDEAKKRKISLGVAYALTEGKVIWQKYHEYEKDHVNQEVLYLVQNNPLIPASK